MNFAHTLYRVIQEEKSACWEVILSVNVRKNSSCQQISNSEWLKRYSSLELQIQICPETDYGSLFLLVYKEGGNYSRLTLRYFYASKNIKKTT